MSEYIGIKNLDTGVGNSGVGFVVVPSYIDREVYIEDCYRTNTLTINGGQGYGYITGVHADINVMQNITFPVDEENRGTAVIWVKDSISQLPIIVGALRKQDEYYSLAENQYRVRKGNDEKTRAVEVFVDGDESCLDINVIGDELKKSNMKVKLSSKNKDSTFILNCDNDVKIFSENSVTIESNKKVTSQVTQEGEVKGSFTYESGKGFIYKDEFDNEINCKGNEVNVISKRINHNSGNESMVLGETLTGILNDMLTAIQSLTVISPVGATSPPVNIANFAAIQAKLDTIKSKISKLD